MCTMTSIAVSHVTMMTTSVLIKSAEMIVTYLPYKKDLNMTKVMTTNLSPFVNYTFKIYAKNRVSKVAKQRHGVEEIFAAITVRTNGSSKSLIFFLEKLQYAV